MPNDTPAPDDRMPVEQAASTVANDDQDLFENFLTELNATAIRLKHSQDEADLPPGGTAILQLLEANGALTVPRLASARGTSRQNIQVVVNRLARKGWVEFKRNLAHKRSQLVSNTEKGRALIPATKSNAALLLQRLSGSISTRDLEVLTGLLRRVREALSPVQNAHSRLTRNLPGNKAKPRKHPSATGEVNPEAARGRASEDQQTELPVSLL